MRGNMNLRVYVFKRPNMFKVHDNYYNMIGYGELKHMYTIENYISGVSNLTLYYPERFLNIIEQRDLINRIEKAGYDKARIVTSSVYIIQCVNSKNIRIYDDEEIPEDGRFKLSNDFSGMPDDTGLNVL